VHFLGAAEQIFLRLFSVFCVCAISLKASIVIISGWCDITECIWL